MPVKANATKRLSDGAAEARGAGSGDFLIYCTAAPVADKTIKKQQNNPKVELHKLPTSAPLLSLRHESRRSTATAVRSGAVWQVEWTCLGAVLRSNFVVGNTNIYSSGDFAINERVGIAAGGGRGSGRRGRRVAS